jgi:hypothetical protein
MKNEFNLCNPVQYQEVSFELTTDQIARLNTWLVEVNKRAAVKQAGTGLGKLLMKGKTPLPHYGAIGGGVTFSFTETGVGVGCTVKESITGEEIDLSDYENW